MLAARGFEVVLLPAQYVRAYVRRNKTDSADAAALLEAARASDIRPVEIKSIEQQALQAIHRARSQWMATRTAHINGLRGFCREFGLHVPVGARTGLGAMGRAIADDQSAIPVLLRATMQMLLDEIRVLETRIAQHGRQLAAVARELNSCKLLMSVPGIGLLTSTGITAATSGSVSHFTNDRHFASWFGLTPKEHSSGASLAKGQEVTGIRRWALDLQQRSNHNKATCALANKLARICYAVLRDQTPFGQPTTRLAKKIDRQSFGIAA